MEVQEVVLIVFGLAITGLAGWFWSWKTRVETDVKEARDGVLKLPGVVQKLEAVSLRLEAVVPDITLRLNTLEIHRAADEARLAAIEREQRELDEWREDHVVRSVEMRADLRELQQRFQSPPEGIRKISPPDDQV